MPLSAELEKLVNLIQDPTEREARRKELTEMSEGTLRQADYSRKMNELAEAKKAQEEKHQSNLAWYDRASKQYNTLEADLKAAQERVSALESAKSGTGDLDNEDETDLEKQLAAARKDVENANKQISDLGNTVKTFNQMVSDGKLLTAEKFEEELNKRGDALGAALLDIIDLQDQHRKDFGTELDRKTLIEEAHKRNGNLKDAYKAITEKARDEKTRKDIEAEVEKKWQDKMKNSNMPISQNGEPILGPLQQRLQKKDTGIPEDVDADGSGRLGSLIGNELRQEGKV